MLKNMPKLVFIIALFLFTLSACRAQEQGDSLFTTSGTAMPVDSSVKSPLGAVIRSAILPGLGQFYNEAYWKVPIVLGLTGFLVYGVVHEHGLYSEYSDKYAATITEELPAGNLRWKQFREFYRDRRDTYAWWLFIAYLFQIADAFVDAHMFSFDVSDVSALSVLPAPNGLQLQFRF